MAQTKKRSNVTKLVITAMLSAVAVVLQYLEFGVPFVPSFLKFDFSDIPELIGAFILGPVGGVLICLIKNLIHMLVSQSGFVGELSNFILGAAFALCAGLIYRNRKTKKTAAVACVAAAFTMALVSLPSNYFLIYPIYAKLFGGMELILGLYTAVIPAANTLWKALLIVNVPFTLVKALLCAGVTMLVYKPLSRVFDKLNAGLSRKSVPKGTAEPGK
ncbi:MAG: ECF transporter S component [Clostridia bacterium]|nr:ECF transporter S component [Clostridia bacterium]